MSKELDWSFSNLQEHSSSHSRREITSQAVGLIAGFGSPPDQHPTVVGIVIVVRGLEGIFSKFSSPSVDCTSWYQWCGHES